MEIGGSIRQVHCYLRLIDLHFDLVVAYLDNEEIGVVDLPLGLDFRLLAYYAIRYLQDHEQDLILAILPNNDPNFLCPLLILDHKQHPLVIRYVAGSLYLDLYQEAID